MSRRRAWLLSWLLPLLLAPLAGRGQAPFVGEHRYRGQLGGRAITVVLRIEPDLHTSPPQLSCAGHCRFDDQPATLHYLHQPGRFDPRRPLQLLAADSAHPAAPLAWWRAGQPAGPVLRGSCQGLTGPPQAFELREDYRDAQGRLAALPYEVLHEELIQTDSGLLRFPEWERRVQRATAGLEPRATYSQQFLHFTGPDTLRAGVAPLQCPPPADRQELVQEGMARLLPEERNDDDSPVPLEESYSVGVYYLDFGLLSYVESGYFYTGGAHGGHSIEYYTFDLATGTRLSLRELLLPGAERVLCRLLTQHLRTEHQFPAEWLRQTADYPDVTLAPLPASGFAVVEQGLYFQYGDYEIGGYGDGMPDLTLRWAELLPLLRPDSPLAAMLRARALWPPAPARP